MHYGQDIVVAFSLPFVGCLVKKGLQKGVHGHPRTSLGYALAIGLTHRLQVDERRITRIKRLKATRT